MTIDVTEGRDSPSISYFTETNTCSASSTKPTYDDFTGREVHGVSTPRYNQRMKAGELLPATPWTKFTTSGTFTGSRVYKLYSGGSVICTYTQPKPNTNNWTFTPVSGSQGVVSMDQDYLQSFINADIIDSVVSQALVQLNSSEHDSLTFMAEFAKTVSMFRNLGGNIINFLKRHDAKEIANMWLQGRYGWRTLVFDIQSINSALDLLDTTANFWEARSGFSSNQSLSWSGTRYNAGNNLLLTETAIDVTVEYRGLARGTVKPPSFGGNLAVTAWEIVPFSFVIDWFFTIGQKIALVASGALWADNVSHYGVKVTAESTSVCTLAQASTTKNGYRFASNDATATVKSELIIRNPHSPSVIPSFRINLDKFKIADIIALVIQAFSKHKHS